MHALHHYDISDTRGFLCAYNAPDIRLSGDFATARTLALQLPQILPSGRVRKLLERGLPDSLTAEDVAALSDSEARMAMVHYAFMVQAYVWGDAEAPTVLPRQLAIPIVALADRLGQQPLLPYSAYVLDNWGLIDPDGPVTLDNTFMIQNFLGGQDEVWFVLVHVVIEAQAAGILSDIPKILLALAEDDLQQVQDRLEALAGLWDIMNGIFRRMPERCDPYIYFERVRPYIHGWKDNPAMPKGLIYEGVEAYAGKPQAFRGQTGSQSSIVPCMDALLGIGHATDPLKSYLDQLHIYRPPGHRVFIDDIRQTSRLRAYVERAGRPELTRAYNANVQAVSDFRSQHLEYAASYINKQGKRSEGNDTDVGTGGTPFMRYLKKHRDETRTNLLSV